MRTNVLVDAIIRQTTVLIAQLTVHDGSRSPLTHLADEVFLSLSQELEDQGVTRTVVADMFGLALRSYQRRVNRLRQGAGGDRTLWQSVFEYIQEKGPVTRRDLSDRFRHDDNEAVAAVINDLVRTALVSRAGAGPLAVYAIASPEALRLLTRQGAEETATAMVWLDVSRNPGSWPTDIASRLGLEQQTVERAVEQLRTQGQVTSEANAPLEATAMVISLDAEQGFEAAVFDHFQAMANALAAKLRLRSRGESDPNVGGGTLSFEISEGHPLQTEVLGFLERTRSEGASLWERVEAHNAGSPLSEEDIRRVVFYFGQFVRGEEDDE